MRSPRQHDFRIPVGKYESSPRYITYGFFGPDRPHTGHPPRLATTDSSSSSSLSPPRSPPSPQAIPMANTTSPSKRLLSSAPFRPAAMRLPSFAELNECLSLASDDESSSDGRQPYSLPRPKLAPSPSEMETPTFPRERYGGKVLSPFLEPLVEGRDGSRVTTGSSLSGAGDEVRGLTSGWLPIDDPGRSIAANAHSRRATASAYELPSPSYSWSAPRQQSPSWNSSSSSGGPTPISGSSGHNNRYRPYRRGPSQSPEQSHLNNYHDGHQFTYPQPLQSPPHAHRRHHHSDGASGDGLKGSTKGSANPTIPRRRGKLPKDVTERLKTWLVEHAAHPYPNEDEKRRMCIQTGLSISQVSNWFINARRRILAPQQMSTSAPASVAPATGMRNLTAAVAGDGDGDDDIQTAHLRGHHHQYLHMHSHHHQHHRDYQEKQPTYHHHHQSPHFHSHTGHYSSPETRRMGLQHAPSIGQRRASEILSVNGSPNSTHLEHSSYRRE